MKRYREMADRKWLWVLSICLTFLFGWWTNSSSAPLTQNVFIIIIDGLRNTEAFEDPTHQYIPYIWNDLRPQGAIYTEFYNLGLTISRPAHNSIVTGNWEITALGKLGSGASASIRPDNPTIFEYYRKERGVAQDGVWYVGGNASILPMLYSVAPQYGKGYSASSVLNVNGDQAVWRDLETIMDTYHPSLVFVNFYDTDHMGHSGIWENYTSAILGADQLVYNLWQKIQSDPVYKDKTTMFVLSDHGRHDDDHGGFRTHGGICHGDRHVPFLALGPDVKRGVEINKMATLIDIAPTIEKLLGFSTPLTRGRVLSEMLLPGVLSDTSKNNTLALQHGRLTNSPGLSVSPSMADYKGALHAVWADSMNGNSEIYYSKSIDGGYTWLTALRISNSGIYAGQPAIDVNAFGVHVVWIEYRNDNWHLFYRKSSDYGNTWANENLLYSSVYESENPDIPIGTIWSPYVTKDIKTEAMVIVFSFYPNGIFFLYSGDGGTTWVEYQTEPSTMDFFTYRLHPSIAITGSNIHAVWQIYSEMENFNYEIYFGKSIDKGITWSTPVRLTSNSGYSSRPVIAIDRDAVYVVWNDYRDDRWQVYFIKSMDGGLSWTSESMITNSPVGAWKPDLIQKDARIYLVWVDYRDGNAEIYYKTSIVKGAIWSDEVRLTNNPGLSINPKVVRDLKRVIWEDNSTADWEIYTQPIP